MKVWITGIAGFLGSYLAETLIADGHIVCGNDSLICGDIKNIEHLDIDPLTREWMFNTDCKSFSDMANALKWFRPDVVVHCAATAHEGLSNFSPSFVTENVYGASVATFSAAIAAGAKRIVYMSSMSRYGDQKPPFDESMPTKPVDPYGIAKVAAERTLINLCETHGVNWSIAVPHNIIGTRQRAIDPYRNVAAIMINRCKQGKAPIIYGDGSQSRCFSPVKDCLPSLIKMIDGEADAQIVNIGPDHSTMSINDLAVQIMDLTGFKGEPEYVTARPNEVKEAWCSSDKARKLLGFTIRQSLADCLKEMVDTIQPEPFLYDFPIEIKTNNTPKTWTEKLI